jgi:uncharacterized protein (DUF1330 family)
VSIYALNLFDLEENDLYLRYSRRSPEAVAKHGGRVVALGRLGEGGIQNYLWRTYERLEGLRPLLGA